MPDVLWLLSQIESEQGWLRFPAYFINLISSLKIEDYPLLYKSENLIYLTFLRAFLEDEEILALDKELKEASAEERGAFLTEFVEGFDQGVQALELPKTPQAQQAAQQRFLALSIEEQIQVTKSARYFYSSFFAGFYQTLSVMVHGEKLSSLVAQAEAGSDTAFVKAVQIDRRILTAIPYFKERFTRAQHENDSDFFDLLSYRLKAPPYKGKIRYKALWLTFSMLDQVQLLNLPHPELLKICDDAGLDSFDSRIQSVKNLTDRLREYREFQKRGIVTTN